MGAANPLANRTAAALEGAERLLAPIKVTVSPKQIEISNSMDTQTLYRTQAHFGVRSQFI